MCCPRCKSSNIVSSVGGNWCRDCGFTNSFKIPEQVKIENGAICNLEYGATYLLTIPNGLTSVQVDLVKKSMHEYIVSNNLDIKFLVICEGMGITKVEKSDRRFRMLNPEG